MRFKADVFLFGVVFCAALFVVFSALKSLNSLEYKQGLIQSSGIITKSMR